MQYEFHGRSLKEAVHNATRQHEVFIKMPESTIARELGAIFMQIINASTKFRKS